MEYKIIIKNGANCEVYNKIVKAKDENEALKTILNNVDIACGDTIEVDCK